MIKMIKHWELWCAGAGAVFGATLGALGVSYVALVLGVFAAISWGIWIGKMMYAPDHIRYPQAYCSLIEEELAERIAKRRRGGRSNAGRV